MKRLLHPSKLAGFAKSCASQTTPSSSAIGAAIACTSSRRLVASSAAPTPPSAGTTSESTNASTTSEGNNNNSEEEKPIRKTSDTQESYIRRVYGGDEGFAKFDAYADAVVNGEDYKPLEEVLSKLENKAYPSLAISIMIRTAMFMSAIGGARVYYRANKLHAEEAEAKAKEAQALVGRGTTVGMDSVSAASEEQMTRKSDENPTASSAATSEDSATDTNTEEESSPPSLFATYRARFNASVAFPSTAPEPTNALFAYFGILSAACGVGIATTRIPPLAPLLTIDFLALMFRRFIYAGPKAPSSAPTDSEASTATSNTVKAPAAAASPVAGRLYGRRTQDYHEAVVTRAFLLVFVAAFIGNASLIFTRSMMANARGIKRAKV